MRAAAIFGLTLDATGAHLARAALEAVAYQTLDLIEAMVADGCAPPAAMRVDGGMTANNWLCQFLADILDASGRAAREPRDDGDRRGVPRGARDRRLVRARRAVAHLVG